MRKVFTIILFLGTMPVFGQTVTTFLGVAGESANTVSSSSTISAARIFGPGNMCLDTAGRFWFVEFFGNKVRVINGNNVYVRAGSLTGVAGTTDASGVVSKFNGPSGIAADKQGNLYVVDNINNTIRKISTFVNASNVQTITTFAGDNSTSGFADGLGTLAQFNSPNDIIADADNNLYVSDAQNHRIRKITPLREVTTIAGSNIDGSSDGIGSAASFSSPSGLCWYNNTELLIADFGSKKIRKLNIITKEVTTVAGTGNFGTDDGDVLTTASFQAPVDVAVDNNKNIYVTDGYPANTIRKIAGSCVTTFAGQALNQGSIDGVGTAALFNNPAGILYANNALYISDQDNHTIRKVSIDNMNQTLPKAQFDVSTSIGSINDIITLRDSSKNAIEWNWMITPSSFSLQGGTTLSSANPQVKFSSMGSYSVALKVKSSCFGSDSIVKNNLIQIGNVGLSNVLSDFNLEIAPNPTHGLITITHTSPMKLDATVFTIQGKQIQSLELLNPSEVLDLQFAPKGIYFLRIQGEFSSMIKKIVIE